MAPGRRAERLDVALVQDESIRGKRVDVRSDDVTIPEANIVVACKNHTYTHIVTVHKHTLVYLCTFTHVCAARTHAHLYIYIYIYIYMYKLNTTNTNTSTHTYAYIKC